MKGGHVSPDSDSAQIGQRGGREKLEKVVIRFAGDSGDGMQLTGDRFTSEAALLGNDLATQPNFPAEIRAPQGTLPGVSSFQIQIADYDILTAGDRPDVVPDGAVNFAFLGQFAETPRDTIFTTEYSMRTGMEAVYTLCDVDRGVPEVWGSVYDVRNLLNATVMLRDGKPITDMKLNVVERAVMKKVLKKLGKTDIGMLLREYGAI